jgi:type IV secretory pathway ATPase VirB11/archaellum biosynthesis ATPase
VHHRCGRPLSFRTPHRIAVIPMGHVACISLSREADKSACVILPFPAMMTIANAERI